MVNLVNKRESSKEIEDALPKKVKVKIGNKKYVYVRKDVAEELFLWY